MNFNWTDAQNWLDILDHVWIGFVLIGVAAVPSYFAARNHQGIKDIKSQVVNGHTEPMRADLDRAIAGVEDLAVDVRGIRQDLAMEEDRRRAAVADLYTELDHRTGRHRKES